jgi:hypothetical protein
MVPFEIVYSLYVENARTLEKQLHFRYRSRRLIGGGQEFFRVPSEEVVSEIRKIETEISKERARGARNAEMAVFQMQIGATRIENLISFPMTILFIPCWFGGVWMIREEAHQFMGYSQAAFVTFVAVFGFPILLGWGFFRLHRLLHTRYFEPRFGAAIAAKHQELRLKYPISLSMTMPRAPHYGQKAEAWCDA